MKVQSQAVRFSLLRIPESGIVENYRHFFHLPPFTLFQCMLWAIFFCRNRIEFDCSGNPRDISVGQNRNTERKVSIEESKKHVGKSRNWIYRKINKLSIQWARSLSTKQIVKVRQAPPFSTRAKVLTWTAMEIAFCLYPAYSLENLCSSRKSIISMLPGSPPCTH